MHNIDLSVSRRLRVFLLLAIAFYIVVHLSGCAAVEKFTDDHPQTVAVVEIGAIAVGGIIVAHVIAHGSGASVVCTNGTVQGCRP